MTLRLAHDVHPSEFVMFSDNTTMMVDRIDECSDIANVHFHGSKSVCTPRNAVVDAAPTIPDKPRKGLTRGALNKGRA